MFVFARAITWASLFIAAMLVFVPASILERTGIAAPHAFGISQAIGVALVLIGTGVTVYSVFAFARFGRGTPAPFDPPQRLVNRGPYGVVRNPLYVAAVVALLGAALFFGSIYILVYAVLFLVLSHLLVVLWEEPALRRTFGAEYDAYVQHVGRWLPSMKRHAH